MSTTKWVLDPTHSELQFKLRHLMISTVTGQFKRFNATIETDGDDFTRSRIDFVAEVDSVSTNNEQRDAHLRNSDFFDTPNHPQLLFKSESFRKLNEDEYKLDGVLTMRGVSK